LLSPQKSQRKKAFSLVEISVVLLLIGAIVAGITVTAKYLIKKARVSTARSLTISSVINGIPDNVLWLETSIIETSLSNDSETDGSKLRDGDAITAWSNHSNQNQDPITIAAAGDGATLDNSINYIPAVQFSGSDSNYLSISNAEFLNDTDYTIFITEKREASGEAYFIGASGGDDNQTLLLGYSTDTAPIHSQGSGNEYTASLESFSSYGNQPRVFTFISDSVDGKKMYINGTLAAQDSDTTQISGLTTLDIGKGYTGEIAEIVIFDRSLKTEEMNSIVDYMTTKWKAPNTRLTNASCTSGTVTETGCDQSCAAPSINGATTSSLTNDESDDFPCDGTGYTGNTPEYTCTNGSLSPTPDAGACVDTNGCASGYSASGDSCVADCDTSGVVGSDVASVVAGSTSVSCNEIGYTGNYTFSACSAGSTITGTCDCASGYNLNGGVCEAQCTLELEDSGLSVDVSVDSGATSYTCSDTSGYDGTVTFDVCDDGATLTGVDGTCSFDATCDGGTVTTSNGDVIHTFTSSGTFSCDSDITAQVLVVAGGGAGGIYQGAGGGGAGGLIYESAFNITSAGGPYTVTIGAGGSTAGANGSNSVFSSLTAIGGGGGGNGSQNSSGDGSNGSSGGSGGGAGGGKNSGDSNSGGAGTSSQGNAGSDSGTSSNSAALGGGGGGAGLEAANSTIFFNCADGGAGLPYDISGTTTYYAGGGAGGKGRNGGADPSCVGGLGGGGDGGDSDNSPAPANGTANTGGGGGGNGQAGTGSSNFGSGGSGIVIIRYNSCDTGYTGSDCSSCASGYYDNGGTCEEGCVVSVNGSSTTSVQAGSTSLTCDGTGYTGNFSYTCSAGGTVTGSCGCDTGSGYVSADDICVTSSNEFVSTWTTSNSGVSSSTSVKLPLKENGTYNFAVDWTNDGTYDDTITSHSQAEVTHDYGSSGTYTIKINGTIEGWGFNGGGDVLKITDISKWGNLVLGTDEGKYFLGAENLNVSATDGPDLSSTTSLKYAFAYNYALTTPNFNNWDTSNVTDFSYMFMRGTSFNGSIGDWDTSSATTMAHMFNFNYVFDNDISEWDVSNVTDFTGMFRRAYDFNQDIGQWTTTSATIMATMLMECTSFDQDLGGWDITGVTNLNNLLKNTSGSMSTANYNATLIGWEAQDVPDDIETYFTGSSTSGAGTTAKTALENDHNWTINE